MFDSLTERLGRTLKDLRGQGRLTEDNIRGTMREIRMALLEADVALPVVKQFIERARERGHGDLACNVALVMAKRAGRRPRDLAADIVAALPEDPHVVKTEIAGPGFINFFLDGGARSNVAWTILEQGDAYGRSDRAGGETVHIEFVSANPTGPLHVGHGRGAAYGASVANLLEAVGYRVHREY